MQYVQEISLDVSGKLRYKYIDAKQGDNASRYLKITLLANGKKITPETGETAIFRCLKPDGHSCLNSGTINSDGTVTVELTNQVLACKGTTKADVSLMKGDTVLSTVTFFIQVEEAPISANIAASSDEFLLLVEKTSEAVEAIEEAKAATQSANSAALSANRAASVANSAANEAHEAASAVGDEIDGIVIVDTRDQVKYLCKFRIVDGYPALEITKI